MLFRAIIYRYGIVFPYNAIIYVGTELFWLKSCLLQRNYIQIKNCFELKRCLLKQFKCLGFSTVRICSPLPWKVASLIFVSDDADCLKRMQINADIFYFFIYQNFHLTFQRFFYLKIFSLENWMIFFTVGWFFLDAF